MMNRLGRLRRPHGSDRDRPLAPAETRHRLIVADAVAALKTLPDESIDLVICDPPYNLEMADWDRYDRYLDWAEPWLIECQRVLRSHGSMALFGGLQFQDENGGDLLELMHFLRRTSTLRLVNLIVWNYPNGMSAQRFFANRHEDIAWYAKGPRYVFNLDAVREPYDDRVRTAYSRDKRLRPETLAKGRNPTNVWRIGRLNANSRERTGHPTQKPRALIERLVLALSHPGHWILDPFAGSGTTTRVAIQHGRHSVAIDCDPSLPNHLARQLSDLPGNALPYHISTAA
jgi:site-specific DNA-methyltransferase (adenine-specific)